VRIDGEEFLEKILRHGTDAVAEGIGQRTNSAIRITMGSGMPISSRRMDRMSVSK
jgi:hypothetical protein